MSKKSAFTGDQIQWLADHGGGIAMVYVPPQPAIPPYVLTGSTEGTAYAYTRFDEHFDPTPEVIKHVCEQIAHTLSDYLAKEAQ